MTPAGMTQAQFGRALWRVFELGALMHPDRDELRDMIDSGARPGIRPISDNRFELGLYVKGRVGVPLARVRRASIVQAKGAN